MNLPANTRVICGTTEATAIIGKLTVLGLCSDFLLIQTEEVMKKRSYGGKKISIGLN